MPQIARPLVVALALLALCAPGSAAATPIVADDATAPDVKSCMDGHAALAAEGARQVHTKIQEAMRMPPVGSSSCLDKVLGIHARDVGSFASPCGGPWGCVDVPILSNALKPVTDWLGDYLAANFAGADGMLGGMVDSALGAIGLDDLDGGGGCGLLGEAMDVLQCAGVGDLDIDLDLDLGDLVIDGGILDCVPSDTLRAAEEAVQNCVLHIPPSVSECNKGVCGACTSFPALGGAACGHPSCGADRPGVPCHRIRRRV